VVCVDAACFMDRRHRRATAALALKPGGRLAFTDLVLRVVAGWCGVPAAASGAPRRRVRQLQAMGFEDMVVDELDDAVLGGFAARQSSRLGVQARSPAWRRPAVTAQLIPPCRAAGLGWALFSARRRSGESAPNLPGARA
jgi:hypothetical protein